MSSHTTTYVVYTVFGIHKFHNSVNNTDLFFLHVTIFFIISFQRTVIYKLMFGTSKLYYSTLRSLILPVEITVLHNSSTSFSFSFYHN